MRTSQDITAEIKRLLDAPGLDFRVSAQKLEGLQFERRQAWAREAQLAEAKKVVVDVALGDKTRALLLDLLEYFEQREDASCDEGHWQGNEEMRHANSIRELLAKED